MHDPSEPERPAEQPEAGPDAEPVFEEPTGPAPVVADPPGRSTEI